MVCKAEMYACVIEKCIVSLFGCKVETLIFGGTSFS
jgi:hypothetical protein